MASLGFVSDYVRGFLFVIRWTPIILRSGPAVRSTQSTISPRHFINHENVSTNSLQRGFEFYIASTIKANARQSPLAGEPLNAIATWRCGYARCRRPSILLPRSTNVAQISSPRVQIMWPACEKMPFHFISSPRVKPETQVQIIHLPLTTLRQLPKWPSKYLAKLLR